MVNCYVELYVKFITKDTCKIFIIQPNGSFKTINAIFTNYKKDFLTFLITEKNIKKNFIEIDPAIGFVYIN